MRISEFREFYYHNSQLGENTDKRTPQSDLRAKRPLREWLEELSFPK